MARPEGFRRDPYTEYFYRLRGPGQIDWLDREGNPIDPRTAAWLTTNRGQEFTEHGLRTADSTPVNVIDLRTGGRDTVMLKQLRANQDIYQVAGPLPGDANLAAYQKDPSVPPRPPAPNPGGVKHLPYVPQPAAAATVEAAPAFGSQAQQQQAAQTRLASLGLPYRPPPRSAPASQFPVRSTPTAAPAQPSRQPAQQTSAPTSVSAGRAAGVRRQLPTPTFPLAQPWRPLLPPGSRFY